MLSRTARLTALALPLLVACVLVSTGGWRIHHGQVERVSQGASPVVPVVPAPADDVPTDQAAFVHHLSPSVPWPVWLGLIVLCVLPAVASTLAWSGARRGRERSFSTSA